MFSLRGMNALVTGASGGIGSSICRALAAQGARLAISGSNASKLRAFRDELNDQFNHDAGAHVEITCNLGDTTQVEELIPATVDTPSLSTPPDLVSLPNHSSELACMEREK